MVVAHGFYSVVGVWDGCFVMVVYIKFLVSLVGWGAGVAYLGGCYMGSFLCGMIWVLEDLFTTDLKESCEAYV